MKNVIEGHDTREKSLIARETFWTKTLRTYFPFGLNEVPKVAGNVVESGEVEKLFTPLLPSKSRVRGKRGNKGEIPDGISLYNKMVTLVSGDEKYGWIGKIRKFINAQKNKALVALAKLVHQKVLYVTNPKFRHLILLCIELLSTRLVKNAPSPVKRTPPELIWSLPFLNQGASYLGLGKILRDTALRQSLEKKLPEGGANVIWPTIVWKYSEPIRNKIFNYSNTVAGIDWSNVRNIRNRNGACDCNCSSSSFCNRDLGHIVTGDLSWLHTKLRRLLSFGPKFREPPKVDFSSLETSILENVDGLVQKWAGKLNCPEELWDDWKKQFSEALRARTKKLEKKHWKAPLPGLDDVEIRRELDRLQENFVLIPADKAESNVIIVCKRFFINSIIKELSQEEGAYEEVRVRKEDIQRWATECKEKFKIEVPKEQERCSSFYWTAKMHKKITAMRFLAASHRCFTKKLSSKLTGLLKGVLKEVQTISSLRKRDTGADHCWIIENSKPVLDRIRQINARSDFQTLDIFDFKDLYTKIPHEDLKKQLRFVISLAFGSASKKGNTVLCEAGKKLGAFFKNPDKLSEKEKSRAISKDKLIEMIDFLIDHIFIKVGSKSFRQKVGIPMGTDCGPMLANLYLFGCEYSWLSKKWGKVDPDGKAKDEDTLKTDRRLVTAFAHCFRYIDDLITFNNRDILSQVRREMYPFLTLEKQNTSSLEGDFLDLRFKIQSDGILSKSLYDKRDTFGFDIVAFPNLLSNVHFSSSHGVFVSQLVRFSRICDEFQDFASRAKRLFDRLVNQGFSRRILRNKVEKFFQNYRRSLAKFLLANVGFLMEIF